MFLEYDSETCEGQFHSGMGTGRNKHWTVEPEDPAATENTTAMDTRLLCSIALFLRSRAVDKGKKSDSMHGTRTKPYSFQGQKENQDQKLSYSGCLIGL